MIEILLAASPNDHFVIAKLAQEIWRQHFTAIIGQVQVEYMLGKFQTVDAVAAQIESGSEYYLVKLDGELVAYMGLVPELDRQKMMLSKIYVKNSCHGRGVGRAMLDFIESRCRSHGVVTLWLTVNRFNSGPIEWYKRHGFVIVDAVKKDIGSGFFMDDYIMEKKCD